MIIYKITNKINSKVYIGQTIQDINLRWNSHKSLLRKGTHPNEHLQSSWIKHKEYNFTFEIIETITGVNSLNERECFWIEFFDCMNKDKGYNLQSGGQTNRECSIESRLKMSKSSKGKPKSQEHSRKISESNKNRKVSEETRAKISSSMKGKIRSNKHSQNISKALVGKKYKTKA